MRRRHDLTPEGIGYLAHVGSDIGRSALLTMATRTDRCAGPLLRAGRAGGPGRRLVRVALLLLLLLGLVRRAASQGALAGVFDSLVGGRW